MIYFYYPSRAIGGSEYLILRVYRELQRRGRECAIIDYSDGFFSNRLRGPEDKVFHCDNNLKISLPDARADDVIVALSLSMGALPRVKAPTARLVIWEVHKSFWLFFESRITVKTPLKFLVGLILRKGIIRLANEGGLMVLEGDSLSLATRCGVGSAGRISVVPIGLESVVEKTEAISVQQPVRIVSIGRSVREKIFPLIWFIRRLQEAQISFQLVFITDSIVAAKQEWSRYGVDAPVIMEGLSDEPLRRYLVENADIYVGMGTTVLEAARLGVPCLIIDACNDEVYPATAKVRLGWENQLSNLGCFEPSSQVGHLPADAVRLIIANYGESVQKTSDYFRDNHKISNVCDSFERAISLSRANLISNRWLRVGIALMNLRYSIAVAIRRFSRPRPLT